MKKTILLGLGVLAVPVAAAGTAEAQKKPAAPPPAPAEAPEPTSYVSLSVSTISGDKYSYMVEDIFRVDGEIGDGYLIEAAYGMKLAPDWRGVGLTEWRGDAYWFPDYLGELDASLRV